MIGVQALPGMVQVSADSSYLHLYLHIGDWMIFPVVRPR